MSTLWSRNTVVIHTILSDNKCIYDYTSLVPSKQTAAGFPANGVSVKASMVYSGRRRVDAISES